MWHLRIKESAAEWTSLGIFENITAAVRQIIDAEGKFCDRHSS